MLLGGTLAVVAVSLDSAAALERFVAGLAVHLEAVFRTIRRQSGAELGQVAGPG